LTFKTLAGPTGIRARNPRNRTFCREIRRWCSGRGRKGQAGGTAV